MPIKGRHDEAWAKARKESAEKTQDAAPLSSPSAFAVGDRVRVPGWEEPVVIEAVDNDQITVALGANRGVYPAGALTPAKEE